MADSPKRSRSSFESEEEESFEDEPRLASPPPPPKRQKVEEVQALESNRAAKIKELKTLRINHPNLKIGLTAQLDTEFAAMSDQELQTLSENYHLELTGAQPFATGRATATVLGKVMERVLKVHGFADQLLADTHFVANLDQSLPFTFVNYGPQLQAALSLGTHVINAVSSWQPVTTQLPGLSPPAESSL